MGSGLSGPFCRRRKSGVVLCSFATLACGWPGRGVSDLLVSVLDGVRDLDMRSSRVLVFSHYQCHQAE